MHLRLLTGNTEGYYHDKFINFSTPDLPKSYGDTKGFIIKVAPEANILISMKAKDLVRYILTDEQLKTNVVLADNSAGELGFTPFNDICEVIAEAEKDTTKDVLVVLASDENLADLESIFEKLSHLPNVYIFAVDYKGTQINNVFNPAIPEMHFCENDIAMNIDNTSFVVDM